MGATASSEAESVIINENRIFGYFFFIWYWPCYMLVVLKTEVEMCNPLQYNILHIYNQLLDHTHSWQANRFLGSERISLTLWNLKVRYFQSSMPLLCILMHISAVHTVQSHLDQLYYYPPSYTLLYWAVSFLQVFPPKLCMQLQMYSLLFWTVN